MYLYSGGGVSLPCSRFLDVTQRCEGDYGVYYNQFLVAVPSMRSRQARPSHAVLVCVYLQSYVLFKQYIYLINPLNTGLKKMN